MARMGSQLQYHLYAPPLPHTSSLSRHQLAVNAFFLSPTLREDLQRRAEAIAQGLGPGEGAEIGG
jgi:PAB-dependent poly(A)-specific ribonuclease subunit 3